MPTFDSNRRTALAHGLKAARRHAGLGSAEAALEITRRGLACQRGTLLAWERGSGATSREPYASDLTILAAVYDCTIGELFAKLAPGASAVDDQTETPRLRPEPEAAA
jgi:hypothetical protein